MNSILLRRLATYDVEPHYTTLADPYSVEARGYLMAGDQLNPNQDLRLQNSICADLFRGVMAEYLERLEPQCVSLHERRFRLQLLMDQAPAESFAELVDAQLLAHQGTRHFLYQPTHELYHYMSTSTISYQGLAPMLMMDDTVYVVFYKHSPFTLLLDAQQPITLQQSGTSRYTAALHYDMRLDPESVTVYRVSTI